MQLNSREKECLVLRALSNTKRLRIVYALKKNELCVGKLSSLLCLKQANVSQHLLILKKSGLLSSRKVDKHILYKLNNPRITEVLDLILRKN
jgi:ArsR family transcriptional regulator